jgi:CTP:molybdopterin cytidylyltransferase MocA
MTVAAVVLAAGAATRFGAPKQRELLPSVLERIGASPVDEIVVVEGAYELDLPNDNLSSGIPVRLVRCEEWSHGPGASLRCGLRELGDEVEAAVVVLADGPNLSPSAVERVLVESRSNGEIVAASYAGARGHPLVLPRDLWGDIPDEGLNTRPTRLVPCDDLGAPGDIDRPSDQDQAPA